MAGARLIAAMRRRDKFQLSGGNLIFAPRYPAWLEAPGYWDEICYHDETLAPVFTWSLLDDGGEIPLRFRRRRWQPGRSTTRYRSAHGLAIQEERFITPDDRVVSLVRIANRGESPAALDLLFWTRRTHQSDRPSPAEGEADDKKIVLECTNRGRRADFSTRWELGADRLADSFAVADAECLAPNPAWELTPFAGGWSGSLPSGVSLGAKAGGGALFAALHYRLRIAPGGEDEIALSARIAPPASPPAAAASGTALRKATSRSWERFFDGVPEFRCSDPLWEHLYRYRWYLLRQNLERGGGRMPLDGVCEGTDFFHLPISYSTPPIVFDLRWHRDPSPARRQILNFCRLQEESGQLPGALFHDLPRPEYFYHADWGRALERLQSVHPDRKFVEDVYPALSRYADWLERERDVEGSGMIDVVNMMETGQEFSSRYIPAGEEFDTDDWIATERLKGVDATVYYLFLLRALARAAELLGKGEESATWRRGAARTEQAVRELMWRPEPRIFSDLLPERGLEPTGVRALTCFYPYLAGLASRDQISELRRNLLNPDEFWTEYPAATLSKTDPQFSAEGVWRGKVRSCPWNGRTWPMTNSHMVEVLAAAAETDAGFREPCAELLRKFASLFSADGDPRALSSYEHYHPDNGDPCRYRGIDDYLHCWLIDLIVRYVVGFRPGEDELLVDPFPLGIERLNLKGVPLRGRLYDIRLRGGLVTVGRDGKRIAEGKPPLHSRLER